MQRAPTRSKPRAATSSQRTVRAKEARTASSRAGQVLRFQKSEIALHWAIALPFVVCFLSAVVLVIVYNPAPDRPFRAVFAWTHRISGVCLLLFPSLVLLSSRNSWKLHLKNVQQAWGWTLSDVAWLVRSGLAAINKRISLPDQGKFNAGEKLNFMMVMTTYPLFILTGLLVWLPGVGYYSWLVHFTLAAVATPFLLGHIFMAVINRSTRVGLSGMITGWVDRRWAKHHYRRWYEEQFGDERPARPARPRFVKAAGGKSERPTPLRARRQQRENRGAAKVKSNAEAATPSKPEARPAPSAPTAPRNVRSQEAHRHLHAMRERS